MAPRGRPFSAWLGCFYVCLSLGCQRPPPQESRCSEVLSPAAAQRYFSRFAALRAADQCRLEGLSTSASEMEVRWRTPDGRVLAAQVQTACVRGEATAPGGMVLRASSELGAACPQTTSALRALVSPAAQGAPVLAAPDTAWSERGGAYLLAGVLVLAFFALWSRRWAGEFFERPAATTRLERLSMSLLLSVVCVATIRFVSLSVQTPAMYNDWGWMRSLDHGAGAFLRALQQQSTVRVLTELAFALSLRLFGPVALPLAAGLTLVNLLGTALLARVLLRVGYARPTAVGAALLLFCSAANQESLTFLAANEAQLARLWIAATLLALLRDEAPPRWRWMSLVTLGFLSNELYVVTPLLLLLCGWARGGLAGLAALCRQRHLREAAAYGTLLLSLRVAHFARAPAGNHRLHASAFARNARALAEVTLAHLRAPAAVAVAVAVVALAARAVRGGSVEEAPPGAAEARSRRLLFPVLWSLVSFLPYVFFADYLNPYFFGLSMLGVGLLVFCAFDPSVRLWRAPRLLYPALFVVVAAPLSSLSLRHQELAQVRVVRAEADRAARERSGSGLLFVEVTPEVTEQRRASFEGMLGCTGVSLAMLELLQPGHGFGLLELSSQEMRYVCPRLGDAAVRLSAATVTARPPCRGAPPALEGLAVRNAQESEARALALEFWRSFSARERGEASRARRQLQALRRRPEQRAALSGELAAALDAIERVAASELDPQRDGPR